LSIHGFGFGRWFDPKGCGKGLLAAVISRYSFSAPAELLIAAHKALVKLFREPIHLQPFLITLQSLF
jgi:hypothetical protein